MISNILSSYADRLTKPTPATRPKKEIMVDVADVRADDTRESVGLKVESELGVLLGISGLLVGLLAGNNDGYDDGFGDGIQMKHTMRRWNAQQSFPMMLTHILTHRQRR
jgi:hypothetical protein